MVKKAIDVGLEELIKKMDIEERKADSSIKGYFFQIHLTLNRVLSSDIDTTEYYIEKVEDILEREDLVNEDGKINIVQVKHHETKTTDSKYTEPLLYFYKNFLIAKTGGSSDVFRFILIKYDYSGEKDVEEILKSALKSKAKKNIELQGEIQQLINGIGSDNKDLEKEFINNCKIITSLDLKSTMDKNISIIRDVFKEDKEKVDLAEDFYSWAWTYVVNNFSNHGFYLTKKKLIYLFNSKVNEIRNFLVDHRWNAMETLVTNLGANFESMGANINTIKEDISDLKKENEVAENNDIKVTMSKLIEALEEEINHDEYYEEIEGIQYLDEELLKILNEIKSFILNQLEESDDKKYYFLISLIPESISKEDFLSNKVKYFYKHTHNIDTFLRRLVKIYFYKKHIEKTVNDISELLGFIGNGYWMIKAKEDSKDYYVNLLGGYDKSSRIWGLNTLMKKYIYCYDNNYPDLILFKGNKKGEISKIDISKGQSDNIGVIKRRIDRKKRELHIKCINCLKDDDYNDYSDCANIFKFGCEIERWKS
ncbi:hypothetical protein CN922_21880 [Bacillus cereus]|uniref:hypothetical protein n=1 Tax=Bacillus cereus TaxID=1396 RepID=UPI000BFD9E78|nr:hypothetical protein [Bacillus cereus]PGL47815.1 hypothetical protein CN922_21880 [Bacillus cereus]